MNLDRLSRFCAPPPNTCFLWPPETKYQTTTRSVESFLHSLRKSVAILYNGPRLFPLKLPLPMGDLGPRSSTWFIEPTQVPYSNGISSAHPLLQGLLMWQTDRRW